MVCQRCIMTVKEILSRNEVAYKRVDLGEVELERPLSLKQTEKLKKELPEVGFDLILERNERLISRVKAVIIEEIYSEDLSNKKLSEILSEKLHYDYSHITHLFSESEGKSIKKFYNEMRIERVKELIEYDELSLSMIADKMGYSTAAYLSTSFKKHTGYSPSEYKSLKSGHRSSLDTF